MGSHKATSSKATSSKAKKDMDSNRPTHRSKVTASHLSQATDNLRRPSREDMGSHLLKTVGMDNHPHNKEAILRQDSTVHQYQRRRLLDMAHSPCR